MDPVSAL